jgi:hypothetical protein
VTVANLYEWDREVTDEAGETGVFGLRDGKVYVDCEQENGLLIFSLLGFAEFLEAAKETFVQASLAAARADAALPVPGELG